MGRIVTVAILPGVHEQQHLLIDVAIILGAAFPLLFLGRWLRVPEVISFLVTGIVIGPHALGWIDDTAQVQAIAEVGIALILFFIGLEIPLEKLRAMGRTTFVSGSLQMVFTVAIVVAISLPMGIGVRLPIFYGLLIALGSTAVVMPILSSREEIGAPFARRFLGVSLFQDFAVIPLILLVPAFATGAERPPAAEVFARVAAAVIGVIVLVLVARLVVPRIFRRIAALRSREVFTAAAIVLIIGTIALANRMGISAALGAFAAGVVVAESEFIHEIAAALRPFRDFLSALFFASIGMLLQLPLVTAHFGEVMLIFVVVILIKVVAAYPAFRASRVVPRSALRAAFAVAPIGEFSFLLALEGKRLGVLGPRGEQVFISVAVLTLASTPLLIEAGRRLASLMHRRSDRDESQPPPPRRGRHILVVGYGLNGQNVARVLSATGVSHVVIEEDPARVEVARKTGSEVITADAADGEVLHSAGIASALAMVIAISDADGTRRIVRVARRLSPSVHILVRTRYVSEVERLRELGANEIIPEEFETSLEIVTRLLRVLAVPGNLVAAQLRLLRDEGYRMLRDPALRTAEGRRLSAVLAAGTAQTFLVMPDSVADGKSIDELRIADEHVVVPAILRDGKPMAPPPMTEPLAPGDTLFLVGSHEDLLRLVDRLERIG